MKPLEIFFFFFSSFLLFFASLRLCVKLFFKNQTPFFVLP